MPQSPYDHYNNYRNQSPINTRGSPQRHPPPHAHQQFRHKYPSAVRVHHAPPSPTDRKSAGGNYPPNSRNQKYSRTSNLDPRRIHSHHKKPIRSQKKYNQLTVQHDHPNNSTSVDRSRSRQPVGFPKKENYYSSHSVSKSPSPHDPKLHELLKMNSIERERMRRLKVIQKTSPNKSREPSTPPHPK